MKTREEHIEFEMNYCQHYSNSRGAGMLCAKGMDLKTIQIVPTTKGMKWGPCIGGHVLDNPLIACPHWLRRTREMGEKRAAAIEKAVNQLTIVGPAVNAWRKKMPCGKTEVIECPICKGKLYLSQSSYNGHVWGKCETADCVAWIE